MLPASHASCEAALRTLLRHTEALAEQSAPPSLQASLQIRLGLNIERRLPKLTYGIIKNKDGSTYVSPIFALKYAGWKSEAIVFDETFTQIKKLHIWNTGIGIHRNIFLLENDYGFDKKDWVGLDWVINDKKLFKLLGNFQIFSSFSF